MKGLQEVIQIRGGLQGLSSYAAIFIFWYFSFFHNTCTEFLAVGLLTKNRMDIIGSAVSDTEPRFKKPAELTPVSTRPSVASPYLESLTLKLRARNFSVLNDIALSLEEASHVAEIVNHQIKTHLFWNNGMNGTRLIGPLSHHLLSLPRLTESTLHLDVYPDEALREMTRLTLLVVLARLKLAFTQIADELGPLQERFTHMFVHNLNHHNLFPELQLWALSIIGSTAAQGSSRNLYTCRIGEVACCMDIKCGSDAFRIVRDIFLIDDMMVPYVRALLLESICSDRECCCKDHDLV